MKKIIAFALFFSMFTACPRFPAEYPTVAPSRTQSTNAVPNTRTPLPIPTKTNTPTSTPSATPTRFIGKTSIEHAQIVYYDITGSNARELRESMNRLRPKDSSDGNKAVDALTDWYISWNWPGYGTDDCNLSAAVVTYKIKVIMPRWQVSIDASLELVAKWETYIQNLTLHEQKHVDIIVDNYLSVRSAIQSATCSAAEQEGQKALDSLRELGSSYDRETKHGETQGVIFP